MSLEALTDDVSSEQLRVRALQAASNQSELQPLPKIALPATGVSSIAPASKKAESSVSHVRPQLAAPSTYAMPALIHSHQETERVTYKGTKIFEININQEIANLDRLNVEKEEALQKVAKEVQSKNTWSVFSTVAQYIVSASVLVLGAACLASGVGTAPGALLIASGALGLANRIMHDTGGWEAVVSWFTKSEELQHKIARNIEMGMFFLSLGLGLAGGIWAHAAGAFSTAMEAGRQSMMAKIGQSVGLAGGFMGAGSRIGGAIKERNIAHLQARIREIEAQTTTIQQTIYQYSTGMEKLIESPQAIGDEVRKAVSTSQISFE